MKFKLLLLAMALLNIQVLAQIPVLTSATTNPTAGEVYYRYTCDTTGVTDLGTGAGHTWNYSGLTVSTTASSDTCTRFTYAACSSTPYCGDYTSATLADEEVGFLSGSTATDTVYSYYIFNSTQYSELGTESYSGITQLSSSEVLLNFPFTYNTIQTNAFHILDEGYGVDTITGNIADSIIGDGYGTLILPSGTYTNVLRIHLLNHALDTVHFFGMTAYDTLYSEAFLWFVAGFHMPLLSMTCNAVGALPQQVNLYTQMPLSVPQTHGVVQSYRISPNPAKGRVLVGGITGNARYEIANIQGVRMLEGILTASANFVDVTMLPAGLYVVRIQDENGQVYTQKLVHE